MQSLVNIASKGIAKTKSKKKPVEVKENSADAGLYGKI
jgi:hypothetical protein